MKLSTEQYRTLLTRFNLDLAESRAEAVAWLSDNAYENNDITLQAAYQFASHEVHAIAKRNAPKPKKPKKKSKRLSRKQKREQLELRQARRWTNAGYKAKKSATLLEEELKRQREEARALGTTKRI